MLEKYGTHEIWECKRCGKMEKSAPGTNLELCTCSEGKQAEGESGWKHRTDLEEKEEIDDREDCAIGIIGDPIHG
jgi:hypothetical protein